jgi:uncharacterized membrane protein YkvA (DUF1232 family)
MANASFQEDDAARARFERDQEKIASSVLPKLKRVLRQVPFAEDLLAAYYATLDRHTPFRVRATLLAALAYFVIPFDIIPDMIVGLGYTDDAAIFYAAFRVVAGSITERHREAARRWLQEAGEDDRQAD